MTETITSQRLYQAILHGANRTREKRDDLNRINVFPVVDNDTGNNLAHTMHYILNHAQPHENVRSTLKDIARSALIGARGNSGAIFSQYFNGLYLMSSEEKAVTLSELATYFSEAFNKAYKAIEKPVEGTVITLMRAWAVSFKESLEQRKSMHDLFETSLSEIKQALSETTQKLEALRALGIVDAGALGYYYFMDGFVQAILGQDIHVYQPAAMSLAPINDEAIHRFGESEEIPFRYCTEVLLETTDRDHDTLRNELKSLGDCLLLSSADNLIRVHMHTNEPWKMVSQTATHGKIIEHKADDMVEQNLLAGPPEKKIALVTDSIADLPQEYIFQHNVFQIPLNIMVDGVSYLDKRTIDRAFLRAHMDAASSSQLNSEQINNFLNPIRKHYEKVLILTVSSHMSGTYSRFKETLAEMDPAGPETVLIDTKVNSGAQGLLVRAAVNMIEAGTAFPEIVATIEALRSKAKILVSVLDIAPMAHSGRVSERIGDLLIKLKFKPLVTIDAEGKGTIKGVAFTPERNRKILLKSLRGKHMEDYVIVHADALERAESLKNDMIRLTGKPPLYIMEISSIVTLFAGQGSVAIAYLEKAPN